MSMMTTTCQVLAQIDTMTIPLGNELSVGAIVTFCLWYLFNENQKLKAENKETQAKYEALVKDCHEREIELLDRSNHHTRRSDN